MRDNQGILKERIEAYNKKEGLRVGDYVIDLDGTVSRVTHIYSDGDFQAGGSKEGSFYLGNGYCSYSGSLNSCKDIKKAIYTGKKLNGSIWFFSNDIAEAHNGVYFEMPFRVFKMQGEAKPRITRDWTMTIKKGCLKERYKYLIQHNCCNSTAFNSKQEMKAFLKEKGLVIIESLFGGDASRFHRDAITNKITGQTRSFFLGTITENYQDPLLIAMYKEL
jgi:hypothetical protein